jgi:chaperonin cofactor prefoldin
VLETLEPLPADRKCFRMINGVLVERTVKDVIPALKTNSDGLRKVLEDLVKQYNIKKVEMENWKVYSPRAEREELDQLTFAFQKKNNIQVVQQ